MNAAKADDAGEIFLDVDVLLESVAVADIAGRAIDGRNAERG